VDLIFALSATAISADKTFLLMKDSISEIIDKYGIGNAHYGLVVFGDSASTKVSFSSGYTDSNTLKQFIDSVPRSTRGPALDKAIDEAEVMFNSPAARPDAKKVLVVVIDKNSASDPSVIT
jgi:hypothetical protein